MSNISHNNQNNTIQNNSSTIQIIGTINISNFDINTISNDKQEETIIKNKENDNIINNKTSNISEFDSKDSINNTFVKKNIIKDINYNNQTKSFLPETVKLPIINKDVNTNYALCFGILIPILLIGLILIICYCIKKRNRSKMSSTSNDNLDQNNLQIKNSGIKQPYNRIQNTSGLNNNIGLNPNNLSEIKVKNLKEEINNIISNPSGSSSGRRKRDKKKSAPKNAFDEKKDQIGIQNEIKEQIKQYVIDEHNNM